MKASTILSLIALFLVGCDRPQKTKVMPTPAATPQATSSPKPMPSPAVTPFTG